LEIFKKLRIVVWPSSVRFIGAGRQKGFSKLLQVISAAAAAATNKLLLQWVELPLL
jgi:hypothetical protein